MVEQKMLVRQLHTLFHTPLRKGVPKTEDVELWAEWLSHPIHDLLLNDYRRLIGILYRIDVSEQKLAAAFERDSTQQIALEIARLVIRRELQKVQLRLKYSPGKN